MDQNRREESRGCDLRAECGFYCLFVRRQSEIWKKLIESYCEGDMFPLCARRIYFAETGRCAPFSVAPTGLMPDDLGKLD